MLNQFSRTELLLGKDGMERLSTSCVAVFGMSIGSILNMVFDPLFIFVLDMQVAGAAAATALSNAVCPDREGGDFACLIIFLPPQQSGDQTSTANAKRFDMAESSTKIG